MEAATVEASVGAATAGAAGSETWRSAARSEPCRRPGARTAVLGTGQAEAACLIAEMSKVSLILSPTSTPPVSSAAL